MNDSWIQNFHSWVDLKLFVFVHRMCTQIPNVSISSKVNVLQIYNIPIKLPLFSGKPHCFPPSSVIWRFLSGDRRLFPFEVSGSSARIGTLSPVEIHHRQKELACQRENLNIVSTEFNQTTIAPRLREYGFRDRETFSLWNPGFRSRNAESEFHRERIRNPGLNCKESGNQNL